MNDHETERIADSMHRLRPDWPVKQLRTLLASEGLKDRPRRDVTVALAWVACEAGTSSPYRVLEAGPWWQAAAVEGTTTMRPGKVDPANRCGTCSESKERCQVLWAGDHVFEPPHERPDVDIHRIVAALKDELVPTAPTPEPKTLDDRLAAIPPEKRDPRYADIRAALAQEPTDAEVVGT